METGRRTTLDAAMTLLFISPITERAAHKFLTLLLTLAVDVAFASPACAALASGVYQTVTGATVQETGDRVPSGGRVVPFFATLRFDLAAVSPSLTGATTNAVLEGGAPFALTVRSSSGLQLTNGTQRFTGDYLRDIYPSGTQYIFDWKFSTSATGEVLWNGVTYWAGGHIWYVMISNVALVPLPWLEISREEQALVRITWATNFADYSLEYADSLAPPTWNTVTNVPINAGGRLAVTLDIDVLERFYRLRKP